MRVINGASAGSIPNKSGVESAASWALWIGTVGTGPMGGAGGEVIRRRRGFHAGGANRRTDGGVASERRKA